ncbi:MAG: rane protein of unknown function [Candidatus Saccharibacteria bacterium]|nr:rane protein of unknown function [Candidatus Saccharibacteria bacterium]
MKKCIQLTLASLVTLLGLSFAGPLSAPAGAIDLFSGACGDGTAATTPTTGTGTTTGGAAAGTDGTSTGTGTGTTASGGGSSSSICGAAKQDDLTKIISNIITTILFALGIAAVVMIVIGGIRYTTSNGDSGNIKSAKDTILYAVVGLIVAILAFAIVNFVIARLGK